MIVIPMAGLSGRFEKAGYKQIKYMLPLGNHTVFYYAVQSFEFYFKDHSFLFIIRDVQNAEAFVQRQCISLGIQSFEIVILPAATRGQAETVMEGITRSSCSNNEPITIFNIDTFRPGFRYPELFSVTSVDGFLEVFEGKGENWSYVRPAEGREFRVAETAEKRVISNLCCTGLYHFRSAQLFQSAYAEYSQREECDLDAGELYVAPLYNLLIRQGFDIRYSLINFADVVFCGIPAEYETLRTTTNVAS